MTTYELAPAGAIRCRICGLTSHNPNDVLNKYCGNCHRFHNDMSLSLLMIERALASILPAPVDAVVRERLMQRFLDDIREERLLPGKSQLTSS